MRILLVGAGGVGSAVVPIAARRSFFERMVVADYDRARAERVVDRSAAAGAIRASWPPGSTPRDPKDDRRACAGSTGSATSSTRSTRASCMPIFEGALAAGADYLDMAMSPQPPASRASRTS